MSSIIDHIKQSLSWKLSLGILLMAVPIFMLSIGLLFLQSKEQIKAEATKHAASVLNTQMQRINRAMNIVKTATDINDWEVTAHLDPDSILAYSRFIVMLNGQIDGCSISTEPNTFPKYGRHFSAYTVRDGDSVTTVIEEPYDYFEKVWYKKPHLQGKPCWAVYYDESDSLDLTLDGMIASYSKPLYNDDKHFVGIISTDLSLIRLSKMISEEVPYPESYFVMTGEEGRYFVHPDSTKLFNKTIFSDIDPKQNADIYALGHEMTTGKKGSMRVKVGGTWYQVCYQPVPDTPWSLALVCPESDIFEGYNRLSYILVTLLFVGLLLMFLICWHITKHFLQPLNVLAQQARHITNGNYNQQLPPSQRNDVVGHLQNSFVTMQHTINQQITHIQEVNAKMEKSNAELTTANQLAEEANQRKTIFIHDMSMQIRTPLNLIAGFMQVLRETYGLLSNEEKDNFTDTMKQNSVTVLRMALMLFDVSWRGDQKVYDMSKDVNVSEVLDKCIYDFKAKDPHDVRLDYTNTLPDNKCLHSNALYLHRIIREILFNAKKFAPNNIVGLHVDTHDGKIRFVIEDNGPGIPLEEQQHVFDPFVKLDCFTEGLGLGLGLTRQHVTNLGGTIVIDPEYTDGTRFIIEFPDK